MTMHSPLVVQALGDRLAGCLAIISGLFGVVAFAFLVVFLVMRPSEGEHRIAQALLRSHDAAVILQSLCLIPLAFALEATALRNRPGLSQILVRLAVTSLTLIVVLMSLSLVGVVADVLYMIPQGWVGGWLIVTCRRPANGVPTNLRRLGTVAGLGLALISVFPIGYSLFVDSAILHGPVSDDDPGPSGTEAANTIVHLALAIGTLIGCSTYPIWSALTGRWLLSRSR